MHPKVNNTMRGKKKKKTTFKYISIGVMFTRRLMNASPPSSRISKHPLLGCWKEENEQFNQITKPIMKWQLTFKKWVRGTLLTYKMGLCF
jgi:hypothetical protein